MQIYSYCSWSWSPVFHLYKYCFHQGPSCCQHHSVHSYSATREKEVKILNIFIFRPPAEYSEGKNSRYSVEVEKETNYIQTGGGVWTQRIFRLCCRIWISWYVIKIYARNCLSGRERSWDQVGWFSKTNLSQNVSCTFTGTVSQDFFPSFLHQTISPSPNRHA